MNVYTCIEINELHNGCFLLPYFQASKEEQGKAAEITDKRIQTVKEVKPADMSDDSSSSSVVSFKKIRHAKIAPEEPSKKTRFKVKRKVPVFTQDMSSPHRSPRPNPYSRVIYRNKKDYEHAFYGQEPFLLQDRNISFVPVVTSRPPQSHQSQMTADESQDERTDDDEKSLPEEDASPTSDIPTYRSTADEGKITIDNMTNNAYEKYDKTENMNYEANDIKVVNMKTESSPTVRKERASFPRMPKAKPDNEGERFHMKKKKKAPSDTPRMYASSFINPRKTFTLSNV